MTLQVPQQVLAQTYRTLRACGQGRRECVAFWVGPLHRPDRVDRLVHPRHLAGAGGYEIHRDWLTGFWFELARNKSAIRAQVHTHPGTAFHSATDDEFPVIAQAGFVSIVIPDFALGPETLDSAWVGVMDERGAWHQAAVAKTIEVSR